MITDSILQMPVSRTSVAPAGATKPPPGRYPVTPFLDAARTVLGRAVTIEDVALRLGISRATAYRRQSDGLTEQEADVLACHLLGVHPCLVWPEWFDVLDDDIVGLAGELTTCA